MKTIEERMETLNKAHNNDSRLINFLTRHPEDVRDFVIFEAELPICECVRTRSNPE